MSHRNWVQFRHWLLPAVLLVFVGCSRPAAQDDARAGAENFPTRAGDQTPKVPAGAGDQTRLPHHQSDRTRRGFAVGWQIPCRRSSPLASLRSGLLCLGKLGRVSISLRWSAAVRDHRDRAAHQAQTQVLGADHVGRGRHRADRARMASKPATFQAKDFPALLPWGAETEVPVAEYTVTDYLDQPQATVVGDER